MARAQGAERPVHKKPIDLVVFVCNNLQRAWQPAATGRCGRSFYRIGKNRGVLSLAFSTYIRSLVCGRVLVCGLLWALLGTACGKGVIHTTDRTCTSVSDCRPDEICLNEKCVAESCSPSCLPGETTCRHDGLSVCIINQQRCPEWGDPAACGQQSRCVEGECIDVSGCSDECTEGQLSCAGDESAVMVCDLGLDGCLTFLLHEECGPNGLCSGDRCVCQDACVANETECGAGGGVRTCAGPDADGCLYWGDEVPCGPHQQCDTGVGQCVCAVTCTVGATECGPNGGVRTCEGPGGDGCAYWSAEEPCYPELVCAEDEGACMPDTPEHCYTVNDCLYEGQKLCTTSTEYRVCERDSYTGCLHWTPT